MITCIGKAFLAKDVVGFSSVSGILTQWFSPAFPPSFMIHSFLSLQLHSDLLIIVHKWSLFVELASD